LILASSSGHLLDLGFVQALGVVAFAGDQKAHVEEVGDVDGDALMAADHDAVRLDLPRVVAHQADNGFQ
jgi:hypothetical protein